MPSGFENEVETGIAKQIDLYKKFNEDDYVKILFQLIKALYAAEVNEERLSPIFDNLNLDKLKVLNSLLEILFLDEFFEHFITKNSNLDN